MDCLVLDHKKERLRLANQLGYWNCQRPNDIATKHECAMIALRMKKKYVPDIPDEMIWNKKDKNANVTLGEVKNMFEKASGGNINITFRNSTSPITRSDLSTLSVII